MPLPPSVKDFPLIPSEREFLSRKEEEENLIR